MALSVGLSKGDNQDSRITKQVKGKKKLENSFSVTTQNAVYNVQVSDFILTVMIDFVNY